MRQERIGFALCGSFCTHEAVLRALKTMTEIYETVIPIVSETSAASDTRFGAASDLLEKVKALTGRDAIQKIIGRSRYRARHGQHYRQISARRHGQRGDNGGESAFAQRPACHYRRIQQRRAVRRGQKYRRTVSAEKLLLRAVRTG